MYQKTSITEQSALEHTQTQNAKQSRLFASKRDTTGHRHSTADICEEKTEDIVQPQSVRGPAVVLSYICSLKAACVELVQQLHELEHKRLDRCRCCHHHRSTVSRFHHLESNEAKKQFRLPQRFSRVRYKCNANLTQEESQTVNDAIDVATIARAPLRTCIPSRKYRTTSHDTVTISASTFQIVELETALVTVIKTQLTKPLALELRRSKVVYRLHIKQGGMPVLKSVCINTHTRRRKQRALGSLNISTKLSIRGLPAFFKWHGRIQCLRSAEDVFYECNANDENTNTHSTENTTSNGR